MNDNNNEIRERVVRLEAQTDYIIQKTENQEERIYKLNEDLIEGLKKQEDLLRQMVSGIKEQQQEMHNAYQRMGAFTKGVLWIGGIGIGLATFFLRYGDKIKSFLG